ncbi:hypothetical protein DWZ11_00775 [Megamonas rupellensis]|uniref:Uncharacterized protein n=1 Tax=Megamonas rupellensis TaxID=491921 RepID=A0A412A032_9FIRM|nr:hypothetical protein DWZ11_00775 [Megamonas rupellensis]
MNIIDFFLINNTKYIKINLSYNDNSKTISIKIIHLYYYEKTNYSHYDNKHLIKTIDIIYKIVCESITELENINILNKKYSYNRKSYTDKLEKIIKNKMSMFKNLNSLYIRYIDETFSVKSNIIYKRINNDKHANEMVIFWK